MLAELFNEEGDDTHQLLERQCAPEETPMLRAKVREGYSIFLIGPAEAPCALRSRLDEQASADPYLNGFRVAMRVTRRQGFTGVTAWFWIPPNYTFVLPARERADMRVATLRFYRDDKV